MRIVRSPIAAVLLLASCQTGADRHEEIAEFRCTLAQLPALVQSEPAVTFSSDSTHALQRWRASVGEPVVDRAGRACEDAPLDSILVVSWNTHVGHGDIVRFVADLRGGRVLPGHSVRHFVLLLQEVYRAGDVPEQVSEPGCAGRLGGVGPDIEDVADSLGLALFYAPSMRNGCTASPRQDRGNAILSTLPLANLRAIELPFVRQRRVAALAEVSGKTTGGRDWTLVAASLHLDNRTRGGPSAWVQARARQAAAFAAQLPDSVLLAVGGDLNTINGPNEPAVRIISNEFAHSPEHQQQHTFTSYFVIRSQLDYLFFRCYGQHRSSYWRADQRYGSDHYPIMGFVRVA